VPVCPTCRDRLWVCETHGTHPRDTAPSGLCADGPWMPCPVCNPLGLYPGVPAGATILAAAPLALVDEPAAANLGEPLFPGDQIRLVDVPPPINAGVAQVSIYCNGQLVGDLDIQTCPVCRIGVIHHLRITPSYRRRGLARLAVTTIIDRHPNHTWTTTTVARNPAAQAFWAAIGMPSTGSQATCPHMQDADERTP
jgi:GNAT superfamily N-acetyltransferase